MTSTFAKTSCILTELLHGRCPRNKAVGKNATDECGVCDDDYANDCLADCYCKNFANITSEFLKRKQTCAASAPAA